MSFISERVNNIINQIGEDLTFTDRVATYNASTAENTFSDSEINVKGFVRKYTPRELSGGLVQQIDREVKISSDSLSITPKESDQMKISGKTYTIISVEHRNAKNDDCIYVMQVRGNAN